MSVMMLFYQLHTQSVMKEYVDDFELFFALVACLGHDISHGRF